AHHHGDFHHHPNRGASSSRQNTDTQTKELQANSIAARNSSTNVAGGSSHQGSSKRGQVSLNHLLNFTFPPRQRPTSSMPIRRHGKGANYQPFNKERYMNAKQVSFL